MFENYKNQQSEFYNTIYHAVVDNHKISHAYLIDTSNTEDVHEFALSFAQFLLCKNHHTNLDSCENCTLCQFIRSGVDEHIQVIKPEGSWIKKEQLYNLKNQFSKKSLDDYSQIYIIEQAEKLNSAAANSLLKFIEEPDDQVIAILTTENRYKVLPTILSRCQVYCLKGTNEEELLEKNNDSNIFDFLMDLEKNSYGTICYIQKLWHEKYKTKEDFTFAFSNIQNIFVELIQYKVNETTRLSQYLNEIKWISSNNSFSDLIRKLKVVSEIKNLVSSNANLSLLMDKFIIDYVGGDDHD